MQWPKQLNAPLETVDPEIADIIEHEKARQWKVWFLFYNQDQGFVMMNIVIVEVNSVRIRGLFVTEECVFF